MGWLIRVVVLAALQCSGFSPACGAPHTIPLSSINDNYLQYSATQDDNTDFSRQSPLSSDEDNAKLEQMGNYLTELLMLPWNGGGLPLLYVEDEPVADGEENEIGEEFEGYKADDEIGPSPFKRSRYYRKYPWKRQNSRQTPYKSNSPYHCVCKPNNTDNSLPSGRSTTKKEADKEIYDAENRYLCQPSKDDVFRLLVALHEARQGNKGRTINFCNRKRPAGAIFTNIRFLG